MLEDLRDLLSLAQVRGHEVLAYAVFETQRAGQDVLHDLLSRAPHDLRVELWQRLSKVTSISDDDVVCLEVQLPDGARYFAPAVAWAATRTSQGHTVGCLTPTCSGRSGIHQVVLCDIAPSGPLDVFFIAERTGVRELFRHAIVRERADLPAFTTLAPHAYPELSFADGALRGCRDLSQPFVARRDEIMRHLAVLNDHGAAIFAARIHKDIEDGFRAHKIDISPETSQTMHGSGCLQERTRRYGGKELVFEWHTKIERNIDRIYVHPPLHLPDGPVIVGIIHAHLK